MSVAKQDLVAFEKAIVKLKARAEDLVARSEGSEKAQLGHSVFSLGQASESAQQARLLRERKVK